MTREKTIVAIHGLGEKPEPKVLRDWWEKAIREGLVRNEGFEPNCALEVQLAYWADVMHTKPLDADEMEEAYHPDDGTGPFPRSGAPAGEDLKALLQEGAGKLLERLLHTQIGNKQIRKAEEGKFADLGLYARDSEKRRAVCETLAKVLTDCQEKSKDVILVSHSMGTVIAYDVLTDLASFQLPNMCVEHLVTLGSPLGIEFVEKIVRKGEGQLRVPECVDKWDNFSDPRDPIAKFDAILGSDYKASTREVSVSDTLVINSYCSDGRPNYHKIYGYLRAPEISHCIARFLRGSGGR